MSENKKFDLFLSFANEEKTYATQLYKELQSKGLKVWCSIGIFRQEVSPMMHKINEGIVNSRYALILVSKHYVQKKWPMAELSTFVNIESFEKPNIIPIWYDIDFEYIKDTCPLFFANRFAFYAEDGLATIVDSVVAIVQGKKKIPARPPQQGQQQLFNKVWLTEKPFGLMDYRNPFIGTLSLFVDKLDFHGAKQGWFSSEEKRFAIKSSSITAITHTKMTGDVAKNWIKITYKAGQTIWLQDKSDYLAAAHGIGNLLGGSKNLYHVLQLLYRPSGVSLED